MNESSLVLRNGASGDKGTNWLLCVAHFGTCFSWFIAPLVVWLYTRKAAPAVAPRALAVLLWSLLGTVCAAATCGLAVPVFLVIHVWAGIKELREEPFVYPFATDLAKSLTN